MNKEAEALDYSS